MIISGNTVERPIISLDGLLAFDSRFHLLQGKQLRRLWGRTKFAQAIASQSVVRARNLCERAKFHTGYMRTNAPLVYLQAQNIERAVFAQFCFYNLARRCTQHFLVS